MLTGIYQSIVLLAVIIVFYLMDSVLISHYDKQRQAEGSGRSLSFTIMVLCMAAFMVTQPIWLPWLGIHVEAGWGTLVQIVGLLFLLCAFLLHAWARIHLQQFYAERVELQPDHMIVQSGPYSYIRHPVFTSFFLFVIGLLLFNPSLPTLLVAAYTFWDFPRAATQEEKLLRAKIPGYGEYMARTSRFFPNVRRWARHRES